MCKTCGDPSSTNAKLCGAAQIKRAENAYKVVKWKGEGKTFDWIAETMGLGVATCHKLFGIGIKLMAPPKAKHELSLQYLQLERLYSDIMDALGSTNDPGEKSKLFAQAHNNLEQRRTLASGADLSVAHQLKGRIKHQHKDLIMRIDAEQSVRDSSRARARRTGRI